VCLSVCPATVTQFVRKCNHCFVVATIGYRYSYIIPVFDYCRDRILNPIFFRMNPSLVMHARSNALCEMRWRSYSRYGTANVTARNSNGTCMTYCMAAIIDVTHQAHHCVWKLCQRHHLLDLTGRAVIRLADAATLKTRHIL